MRTIIMSGNKDAFTAREYQISLLKKAIDENTIIYLPTGSGKTYIAIMLIKEFSHLLDLPINSGGKRSVFLVNTVPLVAQQAKCIRTLTHIEKVGEYIGAKNVDNWTKDEWLNEISEHQVLVMTCQIFLDILRHGYITLDSINVIILDECHHAVHDHPMHQLMQTYSSMESLLTTRILGLTASLLNSNCKPGKVMTEVRTLESTLHSKVATVEQMADVLGYSTNPHEKIVTYKEPYTTDRMKYVLDLIKNDIDRLKYCREEKIVPKKPFLKALKSGAPNLTKVVQNIFKDCEYHLATLGQYGGSLALLAHMIELEIMKRKCSTANEKLVCTHAITTLSTARRCLALEMEGMDSERDKIYKYSTDKVKTLFEILRNYSTSNTEIKLKGIVFVERRFTAKVLYHVIKQLAMHDKDLNFIQPEFMVGLASKTMAPSLEGQLTAKWTKDALAAFRTEKANLLVASNVVEEGLDVPRCSLVVRFDDVNTYCTYIQSKGRARDRESMFYMMVAVKDINKFQDKYTQFQEIADILKNFLVGQNDNRTAPSQEEIDYELEEIVDPYCTEIKACVTMVSSISLINRYCSMLPQDRFTTLTVNYYEEEKLVNEKLKFRVMLELPIVSSIKDMIQGEWMSSKRDAKRVAALKACEILHKVGELNENLMPVQNSKKAQDLAEEDGLQDHWIKDEPTEDFFGQPLAAPGTRKRKRQHKKIIPQGLMETSPKVGEKAYIHIIEVTAGYPKPNESENRLLKFYEMINDKQTYGIISSKPLPNLCDFPLFLGIGELKISIKNNYATTVLSKEQIESLRLFHTMLFRDVLDILKHFLIFNKTGDGVGYLIAPICANQTINWDIIKRFPELKTPSRSSTTERQELSINPEDYHSAVVIPWYRTVGNRTAYIVTRVCCEMSPDTVFPTKQFDSYRKYFQDKYHLVTQCEQPLLEVKPISFNKLNTLKPRASRTTKKKFTNDMDLTTFDEHLVPEFCARLDYPAILYLKAAIIPSTIYRLTSLMRAHELIQTISKDLNLKTSLPRGVPIEPLKIDEEYEQRNAQKSETKTEIKKKLELTKSIDMFNDATLDLDNAEKIQQSEVDNFVLAKKLVESEYPWDPTEEPMDVERNIFQQTTIELDFYHKFISNSFDNDDNSVPMNCRSSQLAICGGPSESKLNILQAPPGYIQLSDMLSVLTANSANDICDLERLEALGDSFLKVAVTTFLMMKYPSQNEGQLTTLKCQIIGNKNLYYCAAAKKISGQMNVFEFSPCEDWIPSGFKLPEIVSNHILKEKLSPEVLYELEIPKEEIQQGTLKMNTIDDIMQVLSKASPDNNSTNSMENYFGLQTISDKTSADCIEAMIGQFLKSYGIKTTLKLLGWLRVVPPSDLLTNLFDIKPPSALQRPNTKSDDIDCLLPGYRTLESILKYKFKDRSYLLQALTHASYTPNRLTDCYQRLEFLGDSVLDFLITCHIYENCGRLSPGEITDLRSALVNNITFASLAVRYGFHKYLLAFNPALQDAISKFVTHQGTRENAIDEEVLYLLEETECNIAEYIDVPKVLGDLFESIAGAIFLDSGMSLEVVWKVFYRLMSKEIAAFSVDVPKQVVRVLYESNCSPSFGDINVIENSNVIVMPLTFSYLGTVKKVYGLGINKQQAMKAAAKIALRFMKK